VAIRGEGGSAVPAQAGRGGGGDVGQGDVHRMLNQARWELPGFMQILSGLQIVQAVLASRHLLQSF
jgi:hypothetical protein